MIRLRGRRIAGSGFLPRPPSAPRCALQRFSLQAVWLLPPQYLLPVLLFVLVGLAVATMSEAMRKSAGKRPVAAERVGQKVLLHELNHRTRNNLSMVASVLELQEKKNAYRQNKRREGRICPQGGRAGFTSSRNAHDHLLSKKKGKSLIDMARLPDCVLPKPR